MHTWKTTTKDVNTTLSKSNRFSDRIKLTWAKDLNDHMVSERVIEGFLCL